MELRTLMLGAPLGTSRDATRLDALQPYVAGVQALVRETYGDGPEAAQAASELDAVVAAPPDYVGVAAQRALVLFACHREPAVAAHFDDAYGRDMARRVLPFVVPRFLARQCQTPDAFVLLSLVLAEMWPGERLGNWPRDEPVCGASAPPRDPAA